MIGMYNHVNERTSSFLEELETLPLPDRKQRKKDWINDVHFVFHEKARQTINAFNEIFDEVESNQRGASTGEFCNSIAVVGATGTGKTETSMEFMRQHPEW
nr:hypothetical protein [Candidatus Sigynarchaeota archaeon]